MFISPSFRNIANYIFSNLTSSTKCFSNEMEKNNACIMTIINMFRFFYYYSIDVDFNFVNYNMFTNTLFKYN